MSDEEREGGWKEILLGLVVIVVVLAGAYYGIVAAYTKVFPSVPGVVSLSAYFVDDAGAPVSPDSRNYEKSHIKIIGDVSQSGQLVKNGSVRLTISSTENGLFQQSVYIPFQNGHFETEDPAFRSIRPGKPTEIKAEAIATGLNATATIHLNSEAPEGNASFEYGLSAAAVVLIAVFCWAFTGRRTALKNRTAIIFSYLIIAICLAVPILAAPIMLYKFPSLLYAMIGSPAGLVNTHTLNEPQGETQWALNIGGYSYQAAKPAETSGSKKAAQGTIAEKSTGDSKAGAGAGTPGATGSTSSSSNTTPGPSPNPSKSAEGANPPNTAPSSPSPIPAEVPVSSKSESVAPVVEVQGGLVIPLYVIILSVIGGAINMTRKVPGFQKEGEESDFNLARPISRVGAAVINRFTRAPAGSGEAAPPPATPGPAAPASPTATARPEESLEDQAQAIDDQLVPLVTAQIQRNAETNATLAQIQTLVSKMQEVYRSRKSDEPLLKFNSLEDWAASHPRLRELLRGSWRVELLNQYMYLISAPFLAIVTYYVIDMLGLFKLGMGVVVVMSFSVGLISERIVSWILGIATGYLRTDTEKQTPKTA
jgi:hypothetical protein